jgi:hypothetical protein
MTSRQTWWAAGRQCAAASCCVLALLLCGCESTTRIEARDNRAFVPSVKVGFHFGVADAPSRPQDGHSVEVEASRARGSDSQTLSANQAPVVLGGQTFQAPQQLRHDFTLTHADAVWRWRRFLGGGAVGLEVIAGLSYAGVELATAGPTLQASQKYHSRGGHVGLGLVWRAEGGTSVQARIAEGLTLSGDTQRAIRGELFVNQALTSNVTARAGYTSWKIDGVTSSINSDYRLRLAGPSIGLQFDFGP